MGEQPGYTAPAGWYVDPGDNSQLRWWSGLDWTDHCAPMVQHRPDPDARPRTGAAEPAPARDIGGSDAPPAGAEPAGTVPDRPLTRRELRLLEEQAAATPPLPPPVPRIAPITSYGWAREADPGRDLPTARVPVLVAEPVTRYLDIPSRWSSASVWVIAFMPWIGLVAGFAALVVSLTAPRAWWWQLGALLLPSLLTLAAAQRDVKRLRIWRHHTVAHWAWSLLGAPAYLIARTVVLRRHAGLGSAPLWVWLVNLIVVVGGVGFLMTLWGMYLTT